MKTISRTLIFIISIIMGLAYILPLWQIYLIAPQYPEGLIMKINISSITGDLQTINNLNHYIGMKTIHADSIKELSIMPYVLGFMIFFGLLTAFINKIFMLITWLTGLALVGVVGIYDFYLWTHDYGTNLDPSAAIKIPGMTYEPPVIGTKKLLNFIAASYPDTGGWIIIISGFLIFFILLYEIFNSNKGNKGKFINTKSPILTILLSFFIFSCSFDTKPVPIDYGKDECVLCKMRIMDNKYGTEIITHKGKIFKFDSIECMVDYYHTNKEEQAKIKTFLITDYFKAPEFSDATNSFFLISENLPSPMGANLTGFGDKESAEKMKKEKDGNLLVWNELIDSLKKK